ncbi:DUF7109 family protein [Haloarchaeobius litoreus]|uniref:Uncharacterized protein n=1 Tax=Haloarchaeobius litoreus TaxID=755306 RepID=A0ABD6DEK9_9EURY|nr:hypothetical protein [Haloarchaeobius litoreus]
MRLSEDELAGVVDTFGGLTRAELEQAVEEVAFRAGADVDAESVATWVDDAIDAYHLVAYDGGDRTLYVAGPRAFPEEPPHGEDLPHIMDVEPRHVDRAALGEQVHDRLTDEATAALAGGNEERAHELLDVSYDLEAWAPVDCTDVRSRLDARL